MAMTLSLQFVLALIVYLCPCFADEVSKACYGTTGLLCTSHNLRCSSGVIVIQEAFYTDSKDCDFGVSNCANVSLSNIQLNGTRNNFSKAELTSLNSDCFLQSACSFLAQRSQGIFSAIVYQCRNDPPEVKYTETSISTHTTTAQYTTKLSTDIESQSSTAQGTVSFQENAGAIAGGVIGVLLVCMIVSAVLVWFKFVRNKKEDQRPGRGSTNHAYTASLSSAATEHRGRKTSNYDYATIHNGDNPVGRVQNHYVLADKPSTENGTTVFMEDDYNHVKHNPSQGASSPGYDTTGSTAAAVNKLKNASSNNIDDDDYNHLGDGKPSVVSSDYDTTVSASMAVAQLGEMKDSEDDYDHFKRSEDRVIDSPYDTANHHSSVSADTTQSPYDLAK